MNKDNARDYLPLVQALADGKVIQVLKWRCAGPREWEDIGDPDFRNTAAEYRIKPEPREIWVNEYTSGGRYMYCTKNDAQKNVVEGGITRRYREVLE